MRIPFAALIAISVQIHAQSLTFDSPALIGSINTDKLTEASGLAVSLRNPGLFWTHNDGSVHHIYAFKFDGSLVGAFDFNKSATDVEDIATGPGPDPNLHYIYIGDIGSNTSTRDTVRIFRVPEPEVDPAWADDPVTLNLANVDTCQLKYPDGKFDAEALLIDPLQKTLYIATKTPGESRIYQISLSSLADGQTRDLQYVRTIPFSVPSAGTISNDGLTIILRREDLALAWNRDPSETVGDALAREGTPIPIVGPPTEPNGESIDFLPDNTGYITLSEGVNQPIYFFRRLTPACNDTPKFTTPPQPTADGLLLNISACPNTTLALEASTSLTTPNWQSLATISVPATSTTTYKTPQPTAPTYYRLRQIQ